MNKLAFLIFCLVLSGRIYSQDFTYNTTCEQHLNQIRHWYNEGAYLMIRSWPDILGVDELCDENTSRSILVYRVLAESYLALLSDADLRQSTFAVRNPHTMSGSLTRDHLFEEKYRIKDWLSALEWMEKPHYFSTSAFHPDEWKLAHGYVLFQLGRYESAIYKWAEVDDKYARYYYPAKFYSALCYANLEDLDRAAELLEEVRPYSLYRERVPYYLAQIYFEQERYEKVMETATPLLASNPGDPDIYRLAGLSAYQIRQPQKTITFLEEYLAKSKTVSAEIYYILGLTHYEKGNHSQAERYFESIAHQKIEIGILANYYLADLALKSGDKAKARNAFAAVYSSDMLSNLNEQARFYYGKLSAELRYDRDAIVHLRDIPEGSPYFEKAQEVMSDLLLNTNDVVGALQTLGTIDTKSQKLREVEHQLLLQSALADFGEASTEQVKTQLISVSQKKDHLPTATESLFWLGELTFGLNQREESANYFERFLSAAEDGGFNRYKDQAQYSLGYIYLKEQKMGKAQVAFEKVVKLTRDSILRMDSEIRLGDLHLRKNEYDAALSYYNRVLNNYPGVDQDYPLYQKAIIQGLQGEPVKKLVSLESLIEQYRTSKYLDDALFETGVTLHQLDKSKDALTSFRFLIDEFENESVLVIPSLLRMALISYNQGDLKQSAEYYKEIFKHQPGYTEKQEALAGLREIYVNDLTQPDVYLELEKKYGSGDVDNLERDSLTYAAAARQYELGNYERAVEAFDNYLDKYDDGQFYLIATYQMGQSALLLEDYDRALPAFEEVCLKNSSRFSDACRKGAEIAYHFANDFQLASILYRKTERVTNSPDEQQKAILGVLRSAYRSGQDSLVYAYSQKALTLDKLGDEDRVFAHYLLGKSKVQMGSMALAVNDFNYVAKHSSSERAAESRYLIAEIYYLSGELSLAEKLTDQANKLNVNYPYWVAKGLILYSDILRKSDDLYNARSALEAVIQNTSEYPELQEEAQTKLNQVLQILNDENKLK